MSRPKALFIGKIWPEPSSSAAGKRTLQLVQFFQEKEYEIIFCSAAEKSEYSFNFSSWNIREELVLLNDVCFDEFVKKEQPDVVVFDRFITEEQFGWRVHQVCPNSLLVLDTSDLHLLRNARETAEKNQTELNLFTDLAQREIASILRCDLSLMISSKEMEILKNQFHISDKILHKIPFTEEKINPEKTQKLPIFSQRNDFVFIGTFQHNPNRQAACYLKEKIWPILRKKLPETKMYIYGSYPQAKDFQLHNPKERFLVEGRTESAIETISHAKVMLAPLKMGAGQKGKFIDAMRAGTPVVTTSIGAESMSEGDWCGFVEDVDTDFVEKAMLLYNDETVWKQAQQKGFDILNDVFEKEKHFQNLEQKLDSILNDLPFHRQQNFIGQILRSNTVNSLRYMSKWIEEKNREK